MCSLRFRQVRSEALRARQARAPARWSCSAARRHASSALGSHSARYSQNAEEALLPPLRPARAGKGSGTVELLHIATLSGVLACIMRHFRASLASLPLLAQPLSAVPVGTYAPDSRVAQQQAQVRRLSRAVLVLNMLEMEWVLGGWGCAGLAVLAWWGQLDFTASAAGPAAGLLPQGLVCSLSGTCSVQAARLGGRGNARTAQRQRLQQHLRLEAALCPALAIPASAPAPSPFKPRFLWPPRSTRTAAAAAASRGRLRSTGCVRC